MSGISPYSYATGSSAAIRTGSITFNADGTDEEFVIAHGLDITPSYACISPKNANAAPSFILNWNATNIIVRYMLAPDAGEVQIGWVVTG